MRVPRVSPLAYRRIVLAALASLVFIMVTGAAVRLTGSGLGCSTWPTCEPDSFTPRSASDTHGMVEWVNRLITGAVMLFTVAAVLGARWRSPYRRDLFRVSLGLPLWVFANALVGALVVWLHLSPVSVIGHFLLSLGAVANAVVLYERATHGVPDPGGARTATPPIVAAGRALVAAACVVIVTGTLVTGSGPHAGDERADRLDLAVGDVVRVHGVAMVVFLALTALAVRRAHQGDAAPAVVGRLHELLGVLVAQAAVGYWQYFTGVPAWLVGFHVLGAALVWIAVLRVWLALTARVPEAAAAGAPAAVRAASGPTSSVRATTG
ncbi:MAG TPA: COX15/CtaA family protein [Acidimicrobiales bacterium]|nr:COX15/CtaA family protein [Acidimicrobiales bacterium]